MNLSIEAPITDIKRVSESESFDVRKIVYIFFLSQIAYTNKRLNGFSVLYYRSGNGLSSVDSVLPTSFV